MADDPTPQIPSNSPAPGDTIAMFDPDGKEVKISRKEWLEEVLPEGLKSAWDDREALYAVCVAALNQNAGAALFDAINHLKEIEPDPERPAVLEGVALLQSGQRDKAEQLFGDFIDKNGPTASILTNLARIQYDRGEKARAEATLNEALALNANLESALGWYLSLQLQRGGEAAAEAALKKLADIPENWRPRIWIAGRLLKKKQADQAISIYRQVIAEVNLPPEALVQITGDLGRAGKIPEIVELVRPIYHVKTHGPLAGLNLLQAMLTIGLTAESADLLQSLDELDHPALKQILAGFKARLAQLAEKASAGRQTAITTEGGGSGGNITAAGAGNSADAGGVQVAAVPLMNPIWTAGLNRPDWLIAQPKPDAIKIALFSLADLTRPADGKPPADPVELKNHTNAVALARSLPIYLAEALRLRSDATALCVLPVVPNVGPATIGAAWPLPNMVEACPKEFTPDYVVCGALTRGKRGTKAELYVFRVRDKEPIKTIRVPIADDFTGSAAPAERDIFACLAPEGIHPADNCAMPPVQAADDYLVCLGHLLMQTLVASGMLNPTKLPTDAVMIDTYFRLAESEPDSPIATLIAASGVIAGLRYRSKAAVAKTGALLQLIDKQSARLPAIRQIAPIVYKILGESGRLEEAKTALANEAAAGYAEWLAAI